MCFWLLDAKYTDLATKLMRGGNMLRLQLAISPLLSTLQNGDHMQDTLQGWSSLELSKQKAEKS
jgi:hypothetical protein